MILLAFLVCLCYNMCVFESGISLLKKNIIKRGTNEMSSLRERRIREREQIYRECGSRIDQLSLQAAQEIESKYKELYGENWRNTLPLEKISLIEDNLKNEKMNAVASIQAYFYALKSSSSSEEVSFRR